MPSDKCLSFISQNCYSTANENFFLRTLLLSVLNSEGSGFTDKGVHHLLTTLPNLKTVELSSRGLAEIIPSHLGNVYSNVQDLTIYCNSRKNLLQLKKFTNMRSLTISPIGRLTNEVNDALSSGCENLEEIHLLPKWKVLGELFLYFKNNKLGLGYP